MSEVLKNVFKQLIADGNVNAKTKVDNFLSKGKISQEEYDYITGKTE